MVFRSLVALLALLVAGRRLHAAAAFPADRRHRRARAAALPRDVEKAVGPAYPAPELQAYRRRVGQRLVSQAGVPGSYRFFVLDQPVANAHALSSGYVFVTRGLLALLDDEAELAAAMGHELGHLTERHAAQRERQRRACWMPRSMRR